MNAITANELEAQGIALLEAALEDQDEAIISVRGRPRFVVMDIAHYERLREADIAAAWQETRAAIERGDAVTETAEAHIARLEKALAEDAL